ncbi:MAG TPA: class II fumarate hydratase [Spirochaetes bacterium]|nr:class II fumarate hydratase [Spirochaetota bacterium]
MGEVSIPSWAYWGAQTQRAVRNFDVSTSRIPGLMIEALALIKKNAALANSELGLIDSKIAEAVAEAAVEVLERKWDKHFPVDVFQTGSGTSWNMNVNEVIANRANVILGHPIGNRDPVHPNDHVNRCQSSNDVIPAAIHIADRIAVERLLPKLGLLSKSLAGKEKEFKDILKLGRTHLQDAVPMTLGQEFGGFKSQIEKGIQRVKTTCTNLEELALGGTAIGTGINCHPRFAGLTVSRIAKDTGLPFVTAQNKFEVIAARDAQVELMGALNTVAVSLSRIANDMRLLASGPRAGIGEIILPSLQPGSSIMPGKVNPVIPEMVIQVAAYISGKTFSVTIAGQIGPLELNMMHPLIAFETLTAMDILLKTCEAFAEKCINGIRANKERCAHWIEWSLALVTPLATEIGYDRAAELAYKAYKENRTIREVVEEAEILPPNKINELLDPKNMI